VTVLKSGARAGIKFLGLIAAPEGVQALHQAHPDVPIHLAALDDV
jgi:uracil phosphoribosyltransferase (EC 2.4.2.9)